MMLGIGVRMWKITICRTLTCAPTYIFLKISQYAHSGSRIHAAVSSDVLWFKLVPVSSVVDTYFV